jgi:hypothetical protein
MDAFQQAIGCRVGLQIVAYRKTPVFQGARLNVRKDG